MPTYDYQCRQCGHTIEVIHSMQESGPERCERCGGELRRVFFPAGIIFKGSGFYKTDSRSAGSSSTSSSTPPAAKPSSGSEPKASSGESGGDSSGSGSAPAKDSGKKESA
ncbi:MAG TPA: FmdB family zinc ribbon protein [Candidatus Limnocylindria bacterium]